MSAEIFFFLLEIHYLLKYILKAFILNLNNISWYFFVQYFCQIIAVLSRDFFQKHFKNIYQPQTLER